MKSAAGESGRAAPGRSSELRKIRQIATVVASTGIRRKEGVTVLFKGKGKKKKGDMEPDPQDPVAALVKVLEGWAAGQERQAAEHAEQLELLRVQAGLQTQVLLQLAGGGGNAKEKPPKINLPKCQWTTMPRHFWRPSRWQPLATGGVGGTPATAFVGGGTAGSPQPSPISAGALREHPKGRAGPDGVISRMAPWPKSGGGGMWWRGCGFDVGCRRGWTCGSREVVRAAENQVISGNCLIGRLL